jgi:pantoate--beta-alanine ligase
VPPVLASTRQELAGLLVPHRARDERVGLVCTMGAMHEGHASLMRRTRAEIGAEAPLVVSLFVNPLQFGPGEDLDRYPRTFDEDLALCDAEGVDVLFAPSVDEIYPGGAPLVTVDPGPLATILEGASRPGHFAGVLTVVAKLFGLVRPEVTAFGEKDYQQLALVRRMSEDLCLGVEVLGGETVREPDGLALSSRNRYLDPEQRRTATSLSRALRAAQGAAADGPAAAEAAALSELQQSPGVDLDYFVITDPALGELPADPPPGTEARAIVAARIGTTRLIDNMPLVVGAADGGIVPDVLAPSGAEKGSKREGLPHGHPQEEGGS